MEPRKPKTRTKPPVPSGTPADDKEQSHYCAKPSCRKIVPKSVEYHRRTVHQPEVTVEGRQTIHRNATGVFECPTFACSYFDKDAKLFRKHYTKCQLANAMEIDDIAPENLPLPIGPGLPPFLPPNLAAQLDAPPPARATSQPPTPTAFPLFRSEDDDTDMHDAARNFADLQNLDDDELTQFTKLNRHGIRFYREQRVLVCSVSSCKMMMIPDTKEIMKHAKEHVHMEAGQVLEATKILDNLPLATAVLHPKKLSTIPIIGTYTAVPSLSYLRPPCPGAVCITCGFAASKSRRVSHHIKISQGKCKGWEDCIVQYFRFSNQKNATNQYFRVLPLGMNETQAGGDEAGGTDVNMADVEALFGSINQKSRQSMDAAKAMNLTDERVDNGPWLSFHQWGAMFEGEDLKKLRLLSEFNKGLPYFNLPPKIFVIYNCITSVIEKWHCVYSGGHPLLPKGCFGGFIDRNLTSVKSNDPRKAFGVNKTTFWKYARLWQRLFIMIFRLRDTEDTQFSLDLTPEMSNLCSKIERQAEEVQEQVKDYIDDETFDRNMVESIENDVLLLSEMLIKQTGGISQNDTVISRFAGVLGIADWGTLSPPARYSPTAAGYLHMIRFMFTASLFSRNIEDGVIVKGTLLQQQFTEEQNKFLLDFTLYPTSEILRLLAAARKMGKGAGGQPVFAFDPKDINKITHLKTGMEFTTDSVKLMMTNAIEDAQAKLAEACLLDKYSQIPSLKPETLHDSFNNGEIGYSFLVEPKNRKHPSLQNHDRFIQSNIAKSTSLRDRFLVENAEGEMEIESVAARRHLKVIAEAKKALLLALHMTGGNTSRSTEILSLRTENTAVGMRTIFIINDLVHCVLRHNKTDNNSQGSTVVSHVGTDGVNEMILQTIAYLLPFEKLLYDSLEPNLLPFTFLFSTLRDGKEKIYEDVLSDAIRDHSVIYTGIKLTLSSLRQLWTYLVRDHVNPKFEDEDDDDEEEDEDWEDPSEAQAGHRVRMARMHYGLNFSLADLRNTTTTSLASFAQASLRFQITFGLREAILRKRKGEDIPWMQQPALLRSNSPLPANTLQPTSNTSATYLPSAAPQLLSAATLLDLEEAMTHIYGPDYRFSSVEQYDSLTKMLSNISPFLSIQRTGAGKSTLIHISAMIAGESVTVCVCPLRAVLDDQLQSARKKGIPAFEYVGNAADASGKRLVFVMSDRIGEDKTIEFISSLQHKGQLARIFVDECHLWLGHGSFRPTIHQVQTISRFNAPLVFLTATMPPQWEARLARQFTLSSFVTVRSHTQRANIRLSVELFESGMKGCKKMEQYTAHRAQGILEQHHDGYVIIFVRAIWVADSIARLLNDCPVYTGQLNDDQRSAAIAQFQQSRVIIATTALGAGVDFPHVRAVIHHGEAYGALEEHQEGGRAGRDGAPAESITILSDIPSLQVLSHTIPSNEREENTLAVQKFYADTSGCRRKAISNFVDGYEIVCRSIPLSILCDLCEGRSIIERPPAVNTAVAAAEHSLLQPLDWNTNLGELFCTAPLPSAGIRDLYAQHQDGYIFVKLLKGFFNSVVCLYCLAVGYDAEYALNHQVESCFQKKMVKLDLSAESCDACWMPSGYCGAQDRQRKTHLCEKDGICFFRGQLQPLLSGLAGNPEVQQALFQKEGDNVGEQVQKWMCIKDGRCALGQQSYRGLDYLVSWAVQNQRGLRLVISKAKTEVGENQAAEGGITVSQRALLEEVLRN